MTSYMNIMVRVYANKAAAQLAATRGGIAAVNKEVVRSNTMAPLGQRHLSSLLKFGNQLQWTGRMLIYNFTLPLALAGAAATKWSLEQEKAFKHVQKVYGDTDAAVQQFHSTLKEGGREARALGQEYERVMGKQLPKNARAAAAAMEEFAESIETEELEALDRAFTQISQHYAVNKKEVLEVAGAWAAAGASGLELAKSVDATMQAVIIGDMEAAKATEALIQIQSQYNLNSEQLMATLAQLNSVENQTGISMKGLIDGFSRAAGVARSAGVDTRYLAAMLAAMSPAAGSAAAAGNGLKTIISRLLGPTKEAGQLLNEMGFDIASMSWNSMTATERLEALAREFDNMGQSQKNAASTVLASRWQINRFDVLMREIINTTGFYRKALNSTETQGESFARMQKELNTVLESNPKAMERMWVTLQNASVKIIQPLIPHIIWLANSLADLATKFSELAPETQKLVLFLLVVLALIGPVVRYIGAMSSLFHVLGFAVAGVWRVLGLFGGALAAISFTPLSKGLTYVTGAFGAFTSRLFGMTKEGAKPLNKFAGFLLGWQTKVLHIFGAGGAALLAITRTGWAAQIGVMVTSMAIKLTMVKVFWVKLQMLWLAATLTTTSRWAAMWVMLKGLTTLGIGAQLATHARLGAIVKIWQLMITAIIFSWKMAWALIPAISGAGWALLRAQWIAQAALGVGIWTRFRTAILVIHATMAAGIVTIWRGLGLALVAFAKGFLPAIAAVMSRIVPILLGPWGIAIAAIVGLLYAFRKQIAQIWNNIVNYFRGSDLQGAVGRMIGGVVSLFNRLPEGVQNAMLAVVRVVRDAALAVYEWFSYINPFARHSPSLVENVTEGMDVVLGQFGRMSKIGGIVRAAYAEIKRFGELTAGLNINAQAAERKDDRKILKKAGAGQALGSYNRLTQLMDKLNPQLKILEGRIAAQEQVVDRWQKKLDRANEVIEKQQKKLDRLQAELQGYQDLLDDANDRLTYFANAPLKGMRAMEDEIFANEMAQKRLRLAMMDIEDAYGTFDGIKDRIEGINGLQEIMRGEQASLRAAGAGSEILSQYDNEISKLEEQRSTYESAASQLNQMSLELEALQRQAERLDLVKALKFDELQRQIEQAANKTEELSFEEIMAGIKTAQADVEKYGGKVAEATQKVKEQEQVVAQATNIRDQIQERLDKEQTTLDATKEKYDQIRDAISAIESALRDVVAQAEKVNDATDKAKEKAKKAKEASEYVSPGLQNFRNAAGAGFPDPGGKGVPMRTDWKSQAGDIDKWTEELALKTGDLFGDLNPFEPLKKKALAVWDWIKDKAKGAALAIGGFFSAAFEGVGGGGVIANIKGKIVPIAEFLTGVFRDIGTGLSKVWELIWPELKKIGKGFWNGLKSIWETVGPELEKFKDLWEPLGKAISNVWTWLKPILAVIIIVFGGLLKGVLSAIGEAIGPFMEALGKIFGGIIKIVRGALEIIIGLFTLDPGMIWGGIKALFGGMWDIIVGIFGGAVKVVWNLVEGFVKGIWNFCKWLYDELVGHSIIPDLINGIKDWFFKLAEVVEWVWNNFVKPVIDFAGDLFDGVIAVVSTLWDGIKAAWSGLKTAGEWVWNNVLKPVWNKFEDVWKDFIKPALSLWWDGVKTAWNALKTAAIWMWDNVLKPVWSKVKELWDTWVKPALALWWDGIKNTWSLLKTLGSWVWDNVLKPVWNRAVDLWNDVKDELGKWRGRIETAWHALTTIGTWIKTNVTDPIFDKITGVWDRIETWFTNNKDKLTEPARSMLKTVIGAVNTLISGLNKLSALPGLDFHIDPISTEWLASGGPIPSRSANRGFMTSGARAIVGEGKANYPEFVIPTDPTYRNRARSLLATAAMRLGIVGSGIRNRTGGEQGDLAQVAANGKTRANWAGTPLYAEGGLLDRIKNKVGDITKSGTDWIVNKGKDMASFLAMGPALLARAAAGRVGWKVPRGLGLYGINSAIDWIKGVDGVYNKKMEGFVGGPGIQNALEWARTQQGKPYLWGGVGPDGYDCSGFMSAVTNVVLGRNPYQRVGATGSFPWPGFSPGYKPGGFTIGSSPSYAGGIGHMAGTLGNVNVESAGGVGVRVGGGARGWNDPGFSQVYHLTNAARGALVRASSGGSIIRAGEGGQDEAVLPLPRDWKVNGFGRREYNFYGDLSFPNITDPNDAEAFISNLESLAGE